MRTALELAETGRYTAMPNPCVGCVVVKDGEVVGEGFHRLAGEAHAEIEALRAAGEAARGATLYLSLEPCCHTGRTPPCVDALLKAGVKRVVAATPDPNPEVGGRGIQALRDAGVDASWGLSAAEAAWSNRGFFKRMTAGRPYVRIKMASSLDGRTALESGESQWISNEASRRDVQYWRARSGALLTTAATVEVDDPRLTVRLDGLDGPGGLDGLGFADVAERRLRVVVDSGLRTDPGARIYEPGARVVVAHTRKDKKGKGAEAAFAERGVELWRFEGGQVPLNELMKRLAEEEINEVQVEAGAEFGGALVGQSLYDELLVYLAPCLLGEASRPLLQIGRLDKMQGRLNLHLKEVKEIGDNLRVLLVPEASCPP